MIGEGDSISFVPDDLWDEKWRLEGQCARGPSASETLKCAGHTGMHLQSYRGRPGITNVAETGKHQRIISKELRAVPLGKQLADRPAEVPLHQCIQCGQQTGGVENHCGARKLWPCCHFGTRWMDSNSVCVEAFHIYSSPLHVPRSHINVSTCIDTLIRIDTIWYRIVCVLRFLSYLV